MKKSCAKIYAKEMVIQFLCGSLSKACRYIKSITKKKFDHLIEKHDRVQSEWTVTLQEIESRHIFNLEDCQVLPACLLPCYPDLPLPTFFCSQSLLRCKYHPRFSMWSYFNKVLPASQSSCTLLHSPGLPPTSICSLPSFSQIYVHHPCLGLEGQIASFWVSSVKT